MISALVADDYDVICLTEHNTVWPDEDLDRLRERFPGTHIFPAIEVNNGTVPEDLLVLGTNDPAYVDLATADRWDDLLAKARDEGVATILAHPCRFTGGHDMILSGLRPDAMEHRTGNHDQAMSIAACAIAEQRHIPLVNAGDLHSTEMIGKYWIETDEPIKAASDIAPMIRNQTYRNHDACADAQRHEEMRTNKPTYRWEY
jgi:hypothetical protein